MVYRLFFRIFLISFLLIPFSGCDTLQMIQRNLEGIKTNQKKQMKSSKIKINDINLKEYPVLYSSFKNHKVNTLRSRCQNKFVDLYIRTTERKYIPKKKYQTFCVAFFYDYFNTIGYKPLLSQMRKAKGKTMVEKALNYERKRGGIKILYSGYKAQRLANAGKNVGVIGEYYYDKAETIFTVHYSVVQPSRISYNKHGAIEPYYVSGLITKRKDVNGRHGKGTFLAQVGVANGLIDFCWAYNRKLNGIIQRDRNGKIKGGIIFVVFPDIEKET